MKQCTSLPIGHGSAEILSKLCTEELAHPYTTFDNISRPDKLAERITTLEHDLRLILNLPGPAG